MDTERINYINKRIEAKKSLIQEKQEELEEMFEELECLQDKLDDAYRGSPAAKMDASFDAHYDR